MSSSTKNVKLGVCKITYDGVDLGYTQGGVSVSVKTDTHKVNVDQFGKSTVNEIIMSRDVTAKVPLAETTLENLVAIMPGATLTVVGGVAASGKINITAIPADGDTVTVNGSVFTFKTVAAGAFQAAIGASVATAATNLAALLNASAVDNVQVATYVATATGVNVTFDALGTDGNAFTLAGGQASVTVTAMAGGVQPTSRSVEVTNGVGVSLLDIARELRLHPINLADTDLSEDFVIPLAATAGAIDFSYDVEKERLYSVDFTGYPDSANGGKLFRVGS